MKCAPNHNHDIDKDARAARSKPPAGTTEDQKQRVCYICFGRSVTVLWVRGFIFSFLVPFVVGYVLPQYLRGPGSVASGAWQAGCVLFAAAALLYLWCLVCFLLAGGTPAIFFTRHLRFLLGEEPPDVVRTGPYRYSRNPMYAAVIAAIFGQAALYRSTSLFIYGVSAAFFFHLVVVLLEEPHLRKTRGPGYEAYLRSVPRWLGRLNG